MPFTRKFYISDTHFAHEAIIGFCDRPFSSTHRMDRFLVEQWNDTVGDNDLIYHLGDFCVPDSEYADYIFRQLRGRKILILGNHDCRPDGKPYPHILDMPWDQPPTLNLLVRDEGHQVFLSHYAQRVWPGSHRGSYHFYGHSHGSIPHLGNSRDVGVDLDDVNFTPKTFQQLVKALPGLPTVTS